MTRDALLLTEARGFGARFFIVLSIQPHRPFISNQSQMPFTPAIFKIVFFLIFLNIKF